MATPYSIAPQSVLAPASEGAQRISDLTLWMIACGALVFAFVMLLLVRGAWSGTAQIRPRYWLVGGGVLLPGAVLSVLLAYGLGLGSALSHPPGVAGLEVEIVARRWWWELRYRDPQGRGWVVLANELHLPRDCRAVLSFSSDDVIHSFWVPALAGKVDVIPGQRTQLVVHASTDGRYRGQCAEYCGTQHANMGLEVVVESPEEFRVWLLGQARPAATPVDAMASRGQQVFLAAGCGSCHAVRGTAAAGTLGPDLTHLAGRRRIAAATLDNDTQSRIEWILGAQHVKPGNLMPSLPPAGTDDMQALTHYLGSLH